MNCRPITSGIAKGPALVSKEPISFLGGIDPQTGIVIEQGHPLIGKDVTGKILIFPNGKGSTVGSYVMLQLAKNKHAPAAIINILAEPIIAVGAIISKIPMVDKPEGEVLSIKNGSEVEVNANIGKILVQLQNL